MKRNRQVSDYVMNGFCDRTEGMREIVVLFTMIYLLRNRAFGRNSYRMSSWWE